MKRTIAETEEITLNNMAKCLMLLSGSDIDIDLLTTRSSSSCPSRVFECKTCNKRFQSFQALGGHRASHKKPRLNGDHDQEDDIRKLSLKPRTHECSICGLQFTVGQALGGHMRRHKVHAAETTESSSPPSSSLSSLVLKRSNSRRVLCLDLNLTPVENDLKLSLAKNFPEKIPTSPMVHCFI